jgi:hypothetical protein
MSALFSKTSISESIDYIFATRMTIIPKHLITSLHLDWQSTNSISFHPLRTGSLTMTITTPPTPIIPNSLMTAIRATSNELE